MLLAQSRRRIDFDCIKFLTQGSVVQQPPSTTHSCLDKMVWNLGTAADEQDHDLLLVTVVFGVVVDAWAATRKDSDSCNCLHSTPSELLLMSMLIMIQKRAVRCLLAEPTCRSRREGSYSSDRIGWMMRSVLHHQFFHCCYINRWLKAIQLIIIIV